MVGLLPLNFELHSLNPSDSHFQCSCSSIGRMAAQVIRRLLAHICFNLLKLWWLYWQDNCSRTRESWFNSILFSIYCVAARLIESRCRSKMYGFKSY